MFGSGITMLTIYNEEINGIKKVAKSLEVTSLLMKGVSEIIKDDAKKTKRWVSHYLIRYIRCWFISEVINR